MSDKNSRGSSKNLVVLIVVVLAIGITMPFHYVPSQLKVFPKENLTLNRTILSDEDIDNAVERYNNSFDVFGQRQSPDELFISNLLKYGLVDSSRIYFLSFEDDPSVGKIEGTAIDADDFQKRVEEQMEKYKDEN